MAGKIGNGLTEDSRYGQQQNLINEIASQLGCVAFRPSYHGLHRDGNTVLLYMPEDDAHNRAVDKFYEEHHLGVPYSSEDEARMYGCTDEQYYYRPYFWSFENTDANKTLSLEYANRGKIDLRGLKWKERLEGEISLAYYRELQLQYAMACGGWYSIPQADKKFNNMSRQIIGAFNKAHQGCFLGSYNGPTHEANIFRVYDPDVLVRNFGADFIIAKECPDLQREVLAWRISGSVKHLNRAASILAKNGGTEISWT